MKICKKCGTSQNNQNVRCVNCGAILDKAVSKEAEEERVRNNAEGITMLADKCEAFYVGTKEQFFGILSIIGIVVAVMTIILAHAEAALIYGLISIFCFIDSGCFLLFPKFMWNLSTLRFRLYVDYEPTPSNLYLFVTNIEKYVCFGIGVLALAHNLLMLFSC